MTDSAVQRRPTLEGIASAAGLIATYGVAAPLVHSATLSRWLGATVWIKNETVSAVGSFKWRGATTAVRRATTSERGAGFVTASTGNHGLAVATAAQGVAAPVRVFVPDGASPMKVDAIKRTGAAVCHTGGDLCAAKCEAVACAQRSGMQFIDDGESVDVIEGAGTIGMEIGQTMSAIDVVFVPMGSGSLASGLGQAIKHFHHSARVVAVCAAGAPAMAYSFRERRPIDWPAETLAGGLLCRKPARLALTEVLRFVDDVVLVGDQAMLSATRGFLEGAQLLVEPSGAAVLAAASDVRGDIAGATVVLVATGANIDPPLIHAALAAAPLF